MEGAGGGGGVPKTGFMGVGWLFGVGGGEGQFQESCYSPAYIRLSPVEVWPNCCLNQSKTNKNNSLSFLFYLFLSFPWYNQLKSQPLLPPPPPQPPPSTTTTSPQKPSLTPLNCHFCECNSFTIFYTGQHSTAIPARENIQICYSCKGQQCSNAIPARDSSVQMLFLPGTAVFKCNFCQGKQCSNAISTRDSSVQNPIPAWDSSVQMLFPPGTSVFKCYSCQGQQCSNATASWDSSVQMLFLPGTAVFKCYGILGQQCSNAIPARDSSVQMLLHPGTAVFKCYSCQGQCSNATASWDSSVQMLFLHWTRKNWAI